VLGDQQHGIDGKLARSESEGIGDRWAPPDISTFNVSVTKVGRGGDLLDEETRDVELGLV
jgi:hypothetical protein